MLEGVSTEVKRSSGLDIGKSTSVGVPSASENCSESDIVSMSVGVLVFSDCCEVEATPNRVSWVLLSALVKINKGGSRVLS